MRTEQAVFDELTDADLVAQSRAGDRNAFERIVGRYQSLVCALTYSSTGNLCQSEDLAQETFLTAWRKIGALREPSKLRSWLCGIARNLTSNSRFRQKREPAHKAAPIDPDWQAPSSEPLPTEQTISREEQDLLWRALERIPEKYREPLVLFYREAQSMERVANSLELSHDAVKQRLARGRKLLRKEVAAFVEGALTATAPGKGFALGVVAALPMLSVSASAASIGAGAVKGSTVAKAGASLGWIVAIVGPVVGILGAWIGVKTGLENAKSERERRYLRRMMNITLGMAAVFGVALGVPIFMTNRSPQANPVLLVSIIVGVSVAYIVALFVMIRRSNRKWQQIRCEEDAGNPQDAVSEVNGALDPVEYRSAVSFLGLPLIHIRLGNRPGDDRRVAKGWIAVGDVAVGVLFAAGGWAVGCVSLGGLSLGLFSIGGGAIGLFALGGIGLAVWCMAGVSVGYLAGGGCALAWKAAFGGLAVAREFAVGGAVYAMNANNAAAKAFVENDPFMSLAVTGMKGAWWMNLIWLPFLLVIWQSARARKTARLPIRQK